MIKHSPVSHNETLLRILAVKDPHGLSDGLNGADVGVGTLEDVIQLRELDKAAGSAQHSNSFSVDHTP